ADETPLIEPDSRIAGAAPTQARSERGGPRAVGERRQAGQAVAQAARLETVGRLGGGRYQSGAKTRRFAEARRAGANRRSLKTRAAAAGADRPPRAVASVARAEGDRCPARPAWHDADEGASGAVQLPAARPS